MNNIVQVPLLLILVAGSIMANAQQDEISKNVIALNQQIDNAVVEKNITVLQKHYADDFVFTHGTGDIDSKESWIKNIQNMPDDNRFVSRKHDSTFCEPHTDIAILTGKLSVERKSKDKVNKYSLKYVRVYALRKKVWQMISHRTYMEWHLN
jgi:ketosteroid isomerase-like protein